MEIHNKRLILLDFIRIPFISSPICTFIKILDQIATALMPSLLILYTAEFIDTALAIFNHERPYNDIYIPLLVLVGVIAYQNISKGLISFADTQLMTKLSAVFQSAIVHKRAQLKYKHIESNDDWELISRVCSNPSDQVYKGLNTVLRMVKLVINILSYVVILTFQVWWVGIVVVLFSAPIIYVSVKSGKANYDGFKKASVHKRRAGYLNSILINRDFVEERTLFSYTDAINERWYEEYETARKVALKVQAKELFRMKSMGSLTVIIAFVVAGVLIQPLYTGAISIGFFIALITAAFNLVQMTSWELSSTTNDLAKQIEFLNDFNCFTMLSEQQGVLEKPDKTVVSTLLPIVEFKNVSFKYPGTSKYIIRNLSMKLEGHKHYAFVGANGAGKTTIIKLLTGLYDDYEGHIYIGNIDMKTFTGAELKAIFSIVYQDFAKYSISLSANIGIGNVENTSKESIDSALEFIDLEYLLDRLPDGVDSHLGKIKDNGVDISGGEWQRIAIARALISNAPIRILDEPTASLDPIAESALYQKFSELSMGRLTILITHRLGAAKLADEIIVIDEGTVVEQGTHDELVSMNSLYAKMFTKQRGWYI